MIRPGQLIHASDLGGGGGGAPYAGLKKWTRPMLTDPGWSFLQNGNAGATFGFPSDATSEATADCLVMTVPAGPGFNGFTNAKYALPAGTHSVEFLVDFELHGFFNAYGGVWLTHGDQVFPTAWDLGTIYNTHQYEIATTQSGNKLVIVPEIACTTQDANNSATIPWQFGSTPYFRISNGSDGYGRVSVSGNGREYVELYKLNRTAILDGGFLNIAMYSNTNTGATGISPFVADRAAFGELNLHGRVCHLAFS